MGKRRDRDLGMDRPITRRDFIGGVAVGLGSATWLTGCRPGTPLMVADPGAQAAAGYYPPGLRGLRGDHEGSFEAAHRMRDGAFPVNDAIDRRETYDLVVVGAGISGLSAAHYFRQQAGPTAKVLVLDNHDDFGGHAKRNEFTPRRPHLDRLRRHPVDRQSGALFGDGADGAHHRPRHRRVALRAGARLAISTRHSASRPGRSSTRRPSAPTRSSSAPRATPRGNSWPRRPCRRRCSSRS